ncbi:hypothetical protein ASC71_14655 [Rhizobium sp. Root1240]|nr:hypothetical protein ASC71_14655 [Rhizobium sp. Root1240]
MFIVLPLTRPSALADFSGRPQWAFSLGREVRRLGKSARARVWQIYCRLEQPSGQFKMDLPGYGRKRQEGTHSLPFSLL